MPTDHRATLANIKRFDQLLAYLRDTLGWPIDRIEIDELMFDYTPEELGIDDKNAAKIQEIKRLRPLSTRQPWGIFFVKFEPKKLPVVALRRILGQVVLKKRATARSAEHASWSTDDLLFVSTHGDGEERRMSFAHFSIAEEKEDRPVLKVIDWSDLRTSLHVDEVARQLTSNLVWPADTNDAEGWRRKWRSAFVVKHGEVVKTSKDLSVRLAALARALRNRIMDALAIENDRGPLTKLMKAFQTSLVHDLDADGFADMYAQTIAYGLLSARIADPHKKTVDDFAGHMRTNPFLRELMETFIRVGGRPGKAGGPGIDFDELGVSEVVQLLDDANMEAVVLDFGDRNPQEDPVIRFYEDFLGDYDPDEKKQRGVFYTPRPVVSYIVRSVDELLRSEFGLEDGLADTTTWGEMGTRHKDLRIPEGVSPGQAFVQILDPATGTGTFLVEVIDIIHKTMVAKWGAQGHGETKTTALWNEYVPEHLLPRLHAYELLMAPYAIAHLKVGLKLYETDYCFGSDQRAQIYLTNALEPAQDFSGTFEFAIPALAHEAKAVNDIKHRQRFTVVIGNPPYAGHSLNNQIEWIVDKVYDYKRGYPDLQKPGQAKWLQDDYVKFLRFAEWHVEQSGQGVVGFITNHAWLDNPTFKGMRRHFLDHFQQLSVLDLHGNANKHEVAADGSPDDNVFEIKQGVAVSLLRRSWVGQRDATPSVERSDLLGTEAVKSAALMANNVRQLQSVRFTPLPQELIFASLDGDRKREYGVFVSVPAIMDRNGDPAPGIVTTHDEFAISFSREEQIEKVEALLATRTETDARKLFTLCSQSQWVYADAKKALRSGDWRKDLVPILYRPFDRRWTTYSRYVAVHRRKRVSRHLIGGANLGLISVRQVAEGIFSHTLVCNSLVESRITISNKGIGFVLPLWLEPEWPETQRSTNYSPAALRLVSETTALTSIDCREKRAEESTTNWDGRGDLYANFGPRDLFDFIYAVLHSEVYRLRYADFLKSDFARIPLTPTGDLFRDLARLGSELVAMHLLESPAINRFVTTYTGPKNPEVGRVGWSNDTVWLDAAATKRGQPATPGNIGFRGVPEAVWKFHIGGYQVCDKWLKDRKGRSLTKDDIVHYQKIVAALNETIRLMKEIDEVIEAHGGWPAAFARTGTSPSVSTDIVKTDSEYTPSPSAPAVQASLFKAAEPLATARTDAPPEKDSAAGGSTREDVDREELVCLARQVFGEGVDRSRETAIAEMARELGYQRTGSRIYEECDNALRTAVRRGILVNEGGLLRLGARSIEQYERAFLKEQFLGSLSGRQWTERGEAIRSFARWMGFRRTGPSIDEIARSLVNGLIRDSRLESDGPMIRRCG